jgi:hypothetical protein
MHGIRTRVRVPLRPACPPQASTLASASRGARRVIGHVAATPKLTPWLVVLPDGDVMQPARAPSRPPHRPFTRERTCSSTAGTGFFESSSWASAGASVRSRRIGSLVRSDPRLIGYRGELLVSAMRRERVTEAEVRQVLRQQGAGSVADVGALVLETDGSFSLVPAGTSVLDHLQDPDTRPTPGRRSRALVALFPDDGGGGIDAHLLGPASELLDRAFGHRGVNRVEWSRPCRAPSAHRAR